MKKYIMLVAFAMGSLCSDAQFWNDTGNPAILPGTNFLGSLNNAALDFRTNNRFRARINEQVTYPLLNNFTNIPADGFTLISPSDHFLHFNPKGPFSRLHLAEGEGDNMQAFGYRLWQRNGVTFTGNGDQGYVGQKYNREDTESDLTDMVVQWSDNPGAVKADRLRFIFTSEYHPGTPTGMNSEEGLEGMRLWPTYYRGINVGVGDFFADGSDPTERLHILDGRVRIEQLPDDPEAEELTKFLIVDDVDPNSDEYGVVKWRYLPTVPPPATSCDWTLNSSTHNNVSTAFGLLDPNCPDEGDAVGIGVDLGAALAEAKLNVASKINGIPVGINVEVNKPAVNPSAASLFGQKIKVNVPNYADAYGMDADVTGHGYRSRGVRAVTKGTAYVSWAGDFTVEAEATYSVGVHGSSTSGTARSVGVHGVSSSETNGNYGTVGEVRGSLGQVQIGLYGRQWSAGPAWINPPSGNYGLFATTEQFVDGTDWAGWFRGNVNVTGLGYIPGGTWASSDENVKENVADLSNAMAVIMALTPKSYDYLVDEYPQLGLPSGQQFGFLAQELEQVIPEAVKDITFQATLDSAGQVISPALPTKIVNTDMVIPFLVAAVKEQQATIVQMQAQLDQCCAANPGMAPGGEGYLKSAPAQENVQEQRLLIIPNPVADLTMLEYYVPTAGKVSLSVSTSDGKPLGTLREEQAEAGAYSYPWNTTKLAAGTYFCTFMLDGAVVVKRAVKVGR